MCGTCPSQNPTGPNFSEPEITTARNVIRRQRPSRGQRSGRRTGPRNHAQQVTGQHEKEHVEQERCKPIAVVRTNRRPRHLVANEQDHRFQ